MKIRNVQRHGDEKIELQMTPMIDIVFQLLIFFIMTFKIVAPEGDFNIKMPIDAPSEAPTSDMLPPIRVTLRANAAGDLAAIQLGQRSLGAANLSAAFHELHEEIRGIVGDDSGPGSIAAETEVELDCDYQLKFSYVIEAITAISGYVDKGPDGRTKVVKLIEKIKFAQPRSG